MVNSPSTSATIRMVAASTAVRMFGRMTRHIVDSHPAPSEPAASVSVLTSIARRPASRAR